MIHFKNILLTIAILVLFSIASATLDAKVLTLCERNLSINLSEGFKIVANDDLTSSEGSFAQGFTIVGTQTKGSAMLQVMDIYDEDTLLYGPEFISRTWKMGVNIAASMLSLEDDAEDEGNFTDNFLGNWSTTDYLGNNVSVTTINAEGSLLSAFGETADIAHWNIGENRYVGLVSFFDQNTTKQIIGSMQVN